MVALSSDVRAHISLSPADTFAQLLLALAVATGNFHMKPRVIASPEVYQRLGKALAAEGGPNMKPTGRVRGASSRHEAAVVRAPW